MLPFWYFSFVQFQKSTSNEEELIQLIQNLPKQNMWAIIMLGGGHFAAAVYQGN